MDILNSLAARHESGIYALKKRRWECDGKASPERESVRPGAYTKFGILWSRDVHRRAFYSPG